MVGRELTNRFPSREHNVGQEVILEARDWTVYHPVYTDLDANGHVNNARYADWLCNSLGTDMMIRNEFASVIINFNSEIRPDDTVSLRRTLKGDEFTLNGECGSRKAFDIGGSLRTRQISVRH